ncbi:protein-disulfide reductase DsbD domain-containing protein [Chryseolinea soli]|uniref:Sugar transporter n=1 Tax=Chryseolinea soli TaxID=2321403 RepID=A0A385SSU8_9BACT|nr:protein-disulfide reductase DsbD domain-containing protein [Chryseolinea soli]AYB33616.1 sugar transporter [Chryseolinea soli]
MKKIVLMVAVFLICATSFAQILKPVKWSYASKRINDKEAIVFIKATMEKGWHIYSQTVPAGGPEATSFSFSASNDYKLKGKTSEPEPITRFENAFKMKLSYFENAVVFQQRITQVGGSPTVKGTVVYMVCNNMQCLSPDEVEFSLPVK